MITKEELKVIATGLRKNVWNREQRLQAAAVIVQVAKASNPKLDEYEFFAEADLIPGRNFEAA